MTETMGRLANPDDVVGVNAIAARSVRALHNGYYDEGLIEEAVRHAYGVDWQLVRDGTYFVAEVDGVVVGAGGWSYRETIGGAHGPDEPASPRLDPVRDAARIRAFYVDPAYVRRGVAALLLKLSEAAAREAGFETAELTATLPSERVWASFGYRTIRDYEMSLPGGARLLQKLMRKSLISAPEA